MANKPDGWMPLYIADYRADTSRLTTEQHGAYLLILMDYWRNGPPPDNDEVLAQITLLPITRWRKHRPMLERFFSLKGGMLHQKRADAEMSKARSMNDQRSEAGKLSAEKRWGKRDDNESGNDNGNGSGNGADNENITSVITESVTEVVTNGARKNAPSPSPTPLPAPEPSQNQKTQGADAALDDQKHKKINGDTVDLPPWLPVDHWKSYLAMRVKIKKPATARAQRMLISKLADLVDHGYSAAQILATSELKCWTDIYEPRAKP